MASYIVAPNTDFMPPPDDVVTYLSEQPRAVMVSGYLRALAAAALVWFGGSLYQSLRTDEPTEDRLPLLAVSGALLGAALTAFGAVATIAAAERVWITGAIDPSSATSLFDLSSIATGNAAPVGFALMIGASGIVWLRSGSRPPWAGRASVVLGVALLSPYAWVMLAIVLIWVPAVGISVFRDHRSASALDQTK